MKKIAQGIVRLRKLILTVAILLLIPSAIGAVATRINYDVLTYLPQELDSMIGERALEDDFHLASTGMITVEGLPTNELIAMKKDIDAVPGVTQTFWLSDVIDPSIPTEMLPADIQQFIHHAHRPVRRPQRQRRDDERGPGDQEGAPEGYLLWRHERHPAGHQGPDQ